MALSRQLRAWHTRLRDEMIKHGFSPSKHDPCLFFRGKEEMRVYVLIHVDDALIFGNRSGVVEARKSICQMFDVKELGPAHCFPRIRIERTISGGYFLSQPKNISDMLQRFAMSDATAKPTPFPVGISLSKTGGNELPLGNQYQALVSSSFILQLNTRPEISHANGILSRFMSCPTDRH
jgi:hypothetical protein